MATIKRLSEVDVTAIFEHIHGNHPLPPHLQLKVIVIPVSSGSKGLGLSPPQYEYEDGLYLFVRVLKKENVATDEPDVPEHLKPYITDLPPKEQSVVWQLSGPQFKKPTLYQQRYCYPKGNAEYSSQKGGALWTMSGADGNDNNQYRLLHVYLSTKRANNRGITVPRQEQAIATFPTDRLNCPSRKRVFKKKQNYKHGYPRSDYTYYQAQSININNIGTSIHGDDMWERFNNLTNERVDTPPPCTPLLPCQPEPETSMYNGKTASCLQQPGLTAQITPPTPSRISGGTLAAYDINKPLPTVLPPRLDDPPEADLLTLEALESFDLGSCLNDNDWTAPLEHLPPSNAISYFGAQLQSLHKRMIQYIESARVEEQSVMKSNLKEWAKQVAQSPISEVSTIQSMSDINIKQESPSPDGCVSSITPSFSEIKVEQEVAQI